MTSRAGDRDPRTVDSTDGVPIRFDALGSGEPTLVLVHGWAFDRRLWDGFAPRLAERQRVVSLDLAGHGDSGGERTPWTLPAFGEDVEAVVEAVGTKEIVLVSHSMGGPVALEAARRMPARVRGIVLVDTLLDVEERTPAEEIDAMVARLEADYAATITQVVSEFMLLPTTPAAVRERVLAHATGLPPGVSIALLREAWSYDPLPALAEIRAPIRAVSSDRLPTNLEANRRHMPGYEVNIVPGTGHYPMLEAPDRFGEALEQALRQIRAAQP